MSIDGGFGSFLLEVELFTFLNCQPFEQSWFAAFLSLSRYAPQIITLLLFTIGVLRSELYLVFFSFGLFGNTLINLGLNELLPSEPRVETCMPRYGNSFSYQVQHITFFTTFILGYFALYRRRATLFQISLTLLIHAWIVLGAHFLNYYRSTAIVSAAVIGAVDAMLWQSLMYWFIVPRFEWLRRQEIVRDMGYQTTLISTEPER